MILGVFDSGLGGLTILKEILKNNSFDKIIYYGDTARVPYGDHDKETLLEYAKEDIAFLRSKNTDEIVVACGTISSNVLDDIKNDYPFKIIGIIDAACELAKQKTKNNKIGVIATQATINTHIFKNKLKDKEVYEMACPEFTPLIESGKKNSQEMDQAINEYLTPLKDKNIDTLILGCTHYPIISQQISAFFNHQINLINAGEIISQEINTAEKKTPQLEIYVSGDVEDFTNKAKEIIEFSDKYVIKNK